jgi:hypothetical protein
MVHQQPDIMPSDEYLALPGSSAYSGFRLTALKDSINAVLVANAIAAKAIAVSGIWVYYVDGGHGAHLRSRSSPTRRMLEQLLGCGITLDVRDQSLRELADIVGSSRYQKIPL